MTRNCIALPVAIVLVVLAAGCGKVNDPATRATHTRNRDSTGSANFNFHFVQEWVQTPTPTAELRTYAIGFSIGSKGYMGGGEGYLPKRGINVVASLNDFWQVDPSSNTWTQMASLLTPIERAATFVVGSQGYVGTGYSFNGSGSSVSNALYQYDQASNSWTQKASLPAAARCDAVGTSVDNEGYFGTGNDLLHPYYNDWWQYDPSSDHWTQKASLPLLNGQARSAASSFSIGQFGFISCGYVYSVGCVNDLWMYDPAADSWVEKENPPTASRYYTTGFNYGSYGALAGGRATGGGYLNDFWYYDMVADTWQRGVSLPGSGTAAAVGFTINGIPYIGTGSTASTTYTSGFWDLIYVFF